MAEPATTASRLVMDADTAKKMGIAARKRVEDHFAWTAIAERTMKVYEWALANPRD